MKNTAFIFLPLLFCFWFASCYAAIPGTGSRVGDSSRVADDTLLLYARSQNVYREGRFAEAAGLLAGERKFVPALVLRGKAEYLNGDLTAARKTLKRALALKPHNTEASLFLARLHRESGETKEAQKLTEKILADNPLDIRALRFAAELARERGAAGEAASAALLDRAAEAALAVSAESALVFLDRARLRWAGGNRNGALEDLARAKSLLLYESPLLKAVEVLESIISEVSS